jgi:hypothetical protein
VNYLFRATDGTEIERDYPVGERPDAIRVGGKRYRHVISLSPGPAIIRDRPHFATSAPRAWTPSKTEKGKTLRDYYPSWGPHGKAAIDSAEDKRRFSDALKKCRPRNSWKYDP